MTSIEGNNNIYHILDINFKQLRMLLGGIAVVLVVILIVTGHQFQAVTYAFGGIAVFLVVILNVAGVVIKTMTMKINLTKIETPVIHTQCDGKTNNVSFKTLRSECWKQAIINYFGRAKACLLKKGSVIKVIFESEKNNNSTVKINFYKTGSIVIQGQKCTQFSDSYFEVIKGKLYQNNNNETSVPNLNSTSIIDNAEETIPKDLNDSQDKVLDNLHDEDGVTFASTPIKQSVVETKLTPKNRILQHSKTIETKFSEINSILSVIDQTMKSFVEKLAQLYNIQEKVPQNVQSVITNSLNTQKNEMLSQWKSIDDKVKHCNGSLDSLHIKTNVLDTQLKQVISKQTAQSASIESLSSIVTSLQDRVEGLETNRRTCNDNECLSIQNDISRVENNPISDTKKYLNKVVTSEQNQV
ncbi:unnamed protein product [Mytilus coruscus]|uniref:Uncharacterized protein n=1 Tax=Mytilus coruscus TaxID=42192 RepID=A0A6J8E1R7_MYTCO|nr:unnamed protein product [Mytilus coruscus]